MKWIRSENKLPPKGEWVLGYYKEKETIVLIKLTSDHNNQEIAYDVFYIEVVKMKILL